MCVCVLLGGVRAGRWTECAYESSVICGSTQQKVRVVLGVTGSYKIEQIMAHWVNPFCKLTNVCLRDCIHNSLCCTGVLFGLYRVLGSHCYEL